jgi:hypothetical protein
MGREAQPSGRITLPSRWLGYVLPVLLLVGLPKSSASEEFACLLDHQDCGDASQYAQGIQRYVQRGMALC